MHHHHEIACPTPKPSWSEAVFMCRERLRYSPQLSLGGEVEVCFVSKEPIPRLPEDGTTERLRKPVN